MGWNTWISLLLSTEAIVSVSKGWISIWFMSCMWPAWTNFFLPYVKFHMDKVLPQALHKVYLFFGFHFIWLMSDSTSYLNSNSDCDKLRTSHNFITLLPPAVAKIWRSRGANYKEYRGSLSHFMCKAGWLEFLVSQMAVCPSSSQEANMQSWNLLKLTSSIYLSWKLK